MSTEMDNPKALLKPDEISFIIECLRNIGEDNMVSTKMHSTFISYYYLRECIIVPKFSRSQVHD